MASRLRIARLDPTPYRPLGDAPPDAALHGRLDALLRRHLPGITASILARPAPSADGRVVEWYSDLAGQPVTVDALSGPAQTEVRTLLADRLASIEALAGRLSGSDPALAEQLRQATIFPGDETVYAVGGQPVITFWGHRSASALPPVAAVPPAPDAIAASAGEPVALVRRRWWFWPGLLAGLLALALLGAALFGYGGLRWPPWGPDYAKQLHAAQSEGDALGRRLDQLEADLRADLARCATERALKLGRDEEDRLRALLADAETRLSDELATCPLRRQLGDAAKDGAELQRRADDLAGALKAKLEACRRKEQEAARKAEADRKASEKKAKAKNAVPAAPASPGETSPSAQPEQPALPPCPGARTPEQAPDVAMVLDVSGSMGFPASATTAEIQKQLSSLGGVMQLGAMLLGRAAGPSRLDLAKKGVTSVVRSLPDDVDVGLVTLQRCPQANVHGFYSSAQRPTLYAKVAGLGPMQGTPLAQGLVEAGKLIDGVHAPAVIVVISDGEDSCGGDPCAAASQMAKAKPKLKINVVDITGSGAANCLAAITGGKVLKPDDGLSFEKTIRQAAQEALKPSHCP